MDKQLKKVLIVDDTPENIDILVGILRLDYDLMVASNGSTALKIAQSSVQPDIILLDVMMPGLDGFEVCRVLKDDSHTKNIPVIFVTANTDKDMVSKGIELGAYYYLTKPISPPVVLAIVASAIKQLVEYRTLQQELEKASSCIKLMTSGNFYFRTPDEARNLALMLSKLSPEPVKLVSGLNELMINAIEHGNLGITYEEKGRLNEQRAWHTEVERRLVLPENQHKKAEIFIERTEQAISFRITDQGSGFDWRPFLEIDAGRASHTHGRGIAMSRLLSFDQVEFQGAGNQVLAVYSIK